jgi:maltose alpha-D-glucosyltransferase/alpha-amylase
MKRIIAMRKKYRAFGRGRIDFLHPNNRKVLAFIRCFEDEIILVVANLSQYAQVADLNLSHFRGRMPVEMFGRTEFPPIGEQPYFITLGPHSFFWFSLEPQNVEQVPATTGGDAYDFPVVLVESSWTETLEPPAEQLSAVLPSFVATRRWFSSKSRHIRDIAVRDAVPVNVDGTQAFVSLLTLEYAQGDPETYVLPLTYASGERAGRLVEQNATAIVARVRAASGEEGLIYDAMYDPAFGRGLPAVIGRRRRLRGAQGELVAAPTRQYRSVVAGSEPVDPVLLRAEQSNSSLRYGNFAILKVFRRVESGPSLDLEMGQALVRAGFRHAPVVAGSLEYRPSDTERGEPERYCIAVLQNFVPNEGDAWQFTLGALGPYFERAQAARERPDRALAPKRSLLALAQDEVPQPALELIGPYLESARLLGRRTAEMHLKLAGIRDRDDFSPEPISSHYQQALFHSLVSHVRGTLRLLRQSLAKLAPATRTQAEWLLGHETEMIERFRAIRNHRIIGQRIRCHGDYHLGQVLSTGSDFVIIDFEGEPARPLSERWIKRPPLRDVTGMIRSFHYAVYSALTMPAHGATVQPEEYADREPWARSWYQWVASAYLRSYLDLGSQGDYLPESREEIAALLDAYLHEKGLYELAYEINNRPDWTHVPLIGLRQMLEAQV